MNALGFGKRRQSQFEPPIEMRFVDLFMIIVTALMFVTVMLSIISAFVGSGRVDVAPTVTTTGLPMALLNHPYALTLAGVGGASPYKWNVKEGPLPEGLTLASDQGLISGIPTRVERSQFTIELVDAENRSHSREVSLEVKASGLGQEIKIPEMRIVSPATLLPEAMKGVAYNYKFSADGGAPPYQWSVTGGSLPSGMDMAESGDLVGTPDKGDVLCEFTVAAVDALGMTSTQEAKLTVNDPPLSLHRKIFAWMAFFFKWAMLLIGAMMVLGLLKIFLFGAPPTQTDGVEGLLPRWRNARRGY